MSLDTRFWHFFFSFFFLFLSLSPTHFKSLRFLQKMKIFLSLFYSFEKFTLFKQKIKENPKKKFFFFLQTDDVILRAKIYSFKKYFSKTFILFKTHNITLHTFSASSSKQKNIEFYE